MRRTKHSKGYWLVHSPHHPYANKAGYVPEQRLVVEGNIGRYINPLLEDVHHKDKDVENNNFDNLILLTKSEHRREHNGWKRIDGEWWKVCRRCGRFLKVEDNFYRKKTGHNEFVTECKTCLRRLSAQKRSPKLTHAERSIVARKASYRGWKTRRKSKIRGC